MRATCLLAVGLLVLLGAVDVRAKERPDEKTAGRVDLAVLDLHRARIYKQIPERWRKRDLAALLFSSLSLPLDERSWLRFVRVYTGEPLQTVFARDGGFWRAVYQRALALQRRERARAGK